MRDVPWLAGARRFLGVGRMLVVAAVVGAIGPAPAPALAHVASFVPDGARQATQDVTQDAGGAPASLSGRVVRGGSEDARDEIDQNAEPERVERAGVPSMTVELHRVTAEGGSIIDSTVTGPDGSFRFSLSDDEERPLFLVAARHLGVRYFGPALHAGLEPEGPYEVVVYDTSAVASAPADLRVAVRHVVVTRGPAGGLDVAEVIDVIGPTDRTLVAASDTLALWSTALPDEAAQVEELEGQLPTGAVEFLEGRARLRSMVPPAGVRLSYTYRVPGETLELLIEHPTARVDLVVAGADAEVRGAAHAETSTRAGRLLHRYEGVSLEPGETLEVRLITPGTGGAGDRWVWIWLAIGAGLLAAAGALWWTGRTV
ncbi:MAG TPA: hypothetical protein VLA33_03960 [Gemmatimonadota bacterium]|nr:hypothetical protein [Gemmatimonadota bacterium]